MLRFDIEETVPHSGARAGKIYTDHGVIETPVFMPVGTQGTVKGVTQKDLYNTIQSKIILGNTYHLYLRPGTDILFQAGGIHKFINWPGAMLTDSGGFQVYSLAHRRKITEEGATFQSHIDGSKIIFTPENVMEIQRRIGADIIMAFDECTPYPCHFEYAKSSMERTHRWLDRCIYSFNNSADIYGYKQTLFPIVQGSVYPELRKKSAEYIANLHCAGNAIGGLSVGEPTDDMYKMTQMVCSILPHAKPRYLMGVGKPENIIESISYGIDMFDCVMPTRNARHGYIFTTRGVINIKNEKWKSDFTAIDPEITQDYTKAYLRHLILSYEYLGGMIASVQNLRFYTWLTAEARKHIIEGTFNSWKENILPIITRRL